MNTALVIRLVVVAGVTLSVLVLGLPVGAAVPAVRTPVVDFNGDGFADLAVGVPGEDISGVRNAGRVVVLYGSRTGLTNAQGWHQNSRGIPGGIEANDRFGQQLASGDVDNDGHSDLAIAATHENDRAGAVTVLFGSAQGLRPSSAVVLLRGKNLTATPGQRLGQHMTIGNVDTAARGREIVISTHSEVHVVRHVRTGARDRVITAGTYGIPPAASEGYGRLGCTHNATAPFDDAPGEELILGQFFQDFSCHGWLLRGGPGGPHSAERVPVVNFAPVIGRDVATGRGVIADFAQHVDEGTNAAGQVRLLRSDSDGKIYPANESSIHQNTPGVPGANEDRDRFGQSIALADFNRDGINDIVAGVPGETIGGRSETGTVTVVHRHRAGTATTSGNFLFHQNKRGVPGSNENRDLVGTSVHADDFDGDGIADIVAFSPSEALGGIQPGVLTVRYTRGGVHYAMIHQGLRAIPGSNQHKDGFGTGLVRS